MISSISPRRLRQLLDDFSRRCDDFVSGRVKSTTLREIRPPASLATEAVDEGLQHHRAINRHVR